MSHNKITTGFVIQKYVTLGGTHICVGQDFVAGEAVYENEEGESIVIDTTKEQYQPFDMKNPPAVIADDGLIFTCPDCSSHRLECCEDGAYNSEVLNIDEEGDFDYGEINASGIVERFQCLNCGFVLSRDDGSSIDDNLEVVEWIKENCPKGE